MLNRQTDSYMHVAARFFMPGRRARKPQVSGALAKVLLKRDRGCSWCGETCDSSAASIEYRNPAPRDSDASIDSDDLIASCSLCQQTEKRSVRFPRGLLVAADKIEGAGFSETVRVALIEYLERRKSRGNVPSPPDNERLRESLASPLFAKAIENMMESMRTLRETEWFVTNPDLRRYDCPNCEGTIVSDRKGGITKCEQCGFVLDGIRRVWS